MKKSNNHGKSYLENKPTVNFKSPDLSKLQEVIIDIKTRIYIPMGADSEAAKTRYLARINNR
jgi:hypothetical protein